AAAAFQLRADAFLEYSGRMERVLNAAGQDVAGFTLMITILAESGRVAEAAAWLRMDNNRHGRLQLSPLVRQRQCGQIETRSQIGSRLATGHAALRQFV
ncbi:MAG: hypothetical protein ACK48R_08935, partial [Planctomyces sp.]